jgi:hypothetical protein
MLDYVLAVDVDSRSVKKSHGLLAIRDMKHVDRNLRPLYRCPKETCTGILIFDV